MFVAYIPTIVHIILSFLGPCIEIIQLILIKFNRPVYTVYAILCSSFPQRFRKPFHSILEFCIVQSIQCIFTRKFFTPLAPTYFLLCQAASKDCQQDYNHTQRRQHLQITIRNCFKKLFSGDSTENCQICLGNAFGIFLQINN